MTYVVRLQVVRLTIAFYGKFQSNTGDSTDAFALATALQIEDCGSSNEKVLLETAKHLLRESFTSNRCVDF